MRSPQNVLESLKSKATNANYHYQRLYRNLYNPEFYLLAYQRIQAKQGNMTAGADGKTIDGMGMKRIENLIEKLRDYSYQPKPARRMYIPKANGKTRPLGIPSFDDKLVQEVVRLILESIYEPTFCNTSHGFRPKRSCHTALQHIKRNYTGVKWFVEGDIKGCFDNVDHHVLVQILRRRIADEHFIGLIWKFLKAGYMENWVLSVSTQCIGATVIVIDINGMKEINDSYGHFSGDDAIKTVAKALKDTLGEKADIYRIGGDEFVCISESNVLPYISQFKDTISFIDREKLYKLSVSIGYSKYHEKYTKSIDDIICRADEKMYKAKKAK